MSRIDDAHGTGCTRSAWRVDPIKIKKNSITGPLHRNIHDTRTRRTCEMY